MKGDATLGAALRRAIAATPAGWSGPSLAIGTTFCRAAVAPPHSASAFIMFLSPVQVDGRTPAEALSALADTLEKKES